MAQTYEKYRASLAGQQYAPTLSRTEFGANQSASSAEAPKPTAIESAAAAVETPKSPYAAFRSTEDQRSQATADLQAEAQKAMAEGKYTPEFQAYASQRSQQIAEPTYAELQAQKERDKQDQYEAGQRRFTDIQNKEGEAGQKIARGQSALMQGLPGREGAQSSVTPEIGGLARIGGAKLLDQATGADPQLSRINSIIDQTEQTIQNLSNLQKKQGYADADKVLANSLEALTKLKEKQLEMAKTATKTADERLGSMLTADTLSAIAGNPALADSIVTSFKGTSYTPGQVREMAYLQGKVNEYNLKKTLTPDEQIKLDKAKADLAKAQADTQTQATKDLANYAELKTALDKGQISQEYFDLKTSGVKAETPQERATRLKTEADTKKIYADLGGDIGAIYSTNSLNSTIPTTGFTENAEITRLHPGNVAMDTNNPGNITADSIPKGETKESYGKKIGATGTYLSPNRREYFIFPDLAGGIDALKGDISSKIAGKTQTKLNGESTLLEYAQVHTGNKEMTANDDYVQVLSRATGLATNSQIKNADPAKLAAGVASAEGFVQPANDKSNNSVLYTQVFSLMGWISKLRNQDAMRYQKAIDSIVNNGVRDPQSIADTLKTFTISDPANAGYAYNLMYSGLPSKNFDKGTLARLINAGKDNQAIQYTENNAMDFAGVNPKDTLAFKDALLKLDTITKNKDYFDKDGNIKESLRSYLGNYDTLENKYAIKTPWGSNNADRQVAQKLAGDLSALMAAYRNQISGTAVTESEAKYLEPLLASVEDQPETIQSKLTAVHDNFGTSINTRRTSAGLPEISDLGKYARADTAYLKSLYQNKEPVKIDPYSEESVGSVVAPAQANSYYQNLTK